mgnify:FL=1
MAQIIKHRRGTAEELKTVTLQKGELGVSTGSVSGLETPILHVGDGANAAGFPVSRLHQGATVPTLNSGAIGSSLNNLLFHDSATYKLVRLHTSGNETLNLTANIAGFPITGSLITSGNISGSQASTGSFGSLFVDGDISASGNIHAVGNVTFEGGSSGTITLGSAADDNIVLTGDVNSNIIPNTDNTFDLGSTAQQWKNIYAKGIISGSVISGSFVGDGSGITGVSATGLDIDGLDAGTAVHQTEDHLVFSDNGTEKKITFSDFEDQIFSNINAASSDIAIAAGGAITIAANSVALSTDTTGNYVESLTAGALIDLQNNSGEGATPTIDVDLTEAGEAAIANGDYILFLDGGATGTHAKEAIADVATLFAGTGMTATNSVINVIGGDGITANADEIEVAVDDATIELSATNGSGAIRVKDGGIDADALATSIAGTGISGGGGTSLAVDFAELTAANPTFANLTLSGNLTVKGTQTIVSSSTVDIGDNIIVLNTFGATGDGGLNVVDNEGTAHTGSLLWNATNDYWYAGISGSTHYRVAEQAAGSNLTENKVLIADNAGRIEAGNITDDGTAVDIANITHLQAGLQVTGSIFTSAGAAVEATGSNLGSRVAFRNESNTQFGYLTSNLTSNVISGIIGYDESSNNLTVSNIIDGGSF